MAPLLFLQLHGVSGRAGLREIVVGGVGASGEIASGRRVGQPYLGAGLVKGPGLVAHSAPSNVAALEVVTSERAAGHP